jgi:hypothetical protein
MMDNENSFFFFEDMRGSGFTIAQICWQVPSHGRSRQFKSGIAHYKLLLYKQLKGHPVVDWMSFVVLGVDVPSVIKHGSNCRAI